MKNISTTLTTFTFAIVLILKERTIMKEILSKILELLKLCECEKKKITKIKYININTNLNESRIITVFSNSPIHQELVIL